MVDLMLLTLNMVYATGMEGIGFELQVYGSIDCTTLNRNAYQRTTINHFRSKSDLVTISV